MCVYGPGSERNETDQEAFWNDLADCLQSFRVNVSLVLLGDLNGHVGDEEVEDLVGRQGVPGRNGNGDKTIEL